MKLMEALPLIDRMYWSIDQGKQWYPGKVKIRVMSK